MENIGNPTINYGAVIDSPNIVCECGCKTFAPAAILKKVSKIVTMTGRDEIVDILESLQTHQRMNLKNQV